MTARGAWFGTVTGKVAFNPDIPAGAARVYLVLVMYRNRDDDTCFPSVQTLIKTTGLSRAGVYRALDQLADLGVIRRTPRFVDGRQTTSLTTLTDGEGVIPDTPGSHE